MPILLARIDDRLIHGQVVVGWAQTLKVEHIVVVNDEIVNNDMQKFLFRMATPSDINLSIFTIQQTAEKIKNRSFDNENVMLLFKSPEDVYKLLKSGGRIGEVNVGGMHFANDKIQLFDAIFVDNFDIEMFEKIKQFNVTLEVRMVPTDTKKDIFKAIDEKFYRKMKDKGQNINGD